MPNRPPLPKKLSRLQQGLVDKNEDLLQKMQNRELAAEETQQVMKKVEAEAAKTLQKEIDRIKGVHGTTAAGKNRVRAPTEYEYYIKFLRTLPAYQNKPKAVLDQVWEAYKTEKKQADAARKRSTLGVEEPVINLNTCSLDELQRIPKLTRETQENLINTRNNLVHPATGQRGFRNWTDVIVVSGV